MDEIHPMVLAAARMLCSRFAKDLELDEKDCWDNCAPALLSDAYSMLEACGALDLLAALEAARHELIPLHGLLAADGAAPSEIWVIDTQATVGQIDAAIAKATT